MIDNKLKSDWVNGAPSTGRLTLSTPTAFFPLRSGAQTRGLSGAIMNGRHDGS
jgi:hypothetical protein